MGRKRIISADQILDATERVVARDGAAQLTLDAVAAQAAISKATVLYCYRSKDDLIEAVVRRGVARDTAFNNAAITSLGDSPNAVIHGRLLAAAAALPEELHAAALSICSALAQDAKLRIVLQDTQAAVIARIRRTSANPRGAMLAYLALEGLKLLEILDWHTWPTQERQELLRDIGWLAETDPQLPTTCTTRTLAKSGGASSGVSNKARASTRPNAKATVKARPQPGVKRKAGTLAVAVNSTPQATALFRQSKPNPKEKRP